MRGRAFYAVRSARHDPAMPDSRLQRPPRRPHAWIPCLLASQLLVGWLWWRLGWQAGLPCMLASHLPFWWGVLWPRSALYGPVLSRLPTRESIVWLTIDDGPSDDTLAILDLLDAQTAKATFFVVGERAQARPQLVHEILRRGHELGNHSMRHPSAWFWALGPRAMAAEIDDAQRVLHAISGQSPRWFRAVVGFANPFVSAPLKRLGLTRVAWSARGFDAVVSDPRQVVAAILGRLHPGAIVLMHEGAAHGRNVETLALLLRGIDAAGFRCVLPAGGPAAASVRAPATV